VKADCKDPIAVASFLEAPLLESFHDAVQHRPDGDLGNECRRRCKFLQHNVLPKPKKGMTSPTFRAEITVFEALVIRAGERQGYKYLRQHREVPIQDEKHQVKHSFVGWPLIILALKAPMEG